jgi:hypothetical protein
MKGCWPPNSGFLKQLCSQNFAILPFFATHQCNAPQSATKMALRAVAQKRSSQYMRLVQLMVVGYDMHNVRIDMRFAVQAKTSSI